MKSAVELLLILIYLTIVKTEDLFFILAKSSMLDVWKDSEYVFEEPNQNGHGAL